MRIRSVKPEFFLHDGLFELELETKLPIRIAYIGLWCAADREGRFKWEPRRLGATILPYDCIDFSRVLDALLTRGFLKMYRVGNACFGLIPSFSKHQCVNPRESKSILPDPDFCLAEDVEQQAQDDVSVTRESPVDTRHNLARGEGKGKEGKGKEEEIDKEESSADASSSLFGPPDHGKSQLQLRAEKLHGKRPTTPWDRAELAAWKAARPAIEDTNEEEWKLLEFFYAQPQSDTFARKGLAQTLNNWAGEITKAKAYKLNGKKFVGAMR